MEHGFVLLGGDTVAPSGLYARLLLKFREIRSSNSRENGDHLCTFLPHGKKLAYLVKYLRIYWTAFLQSFLHKYYESALGADDRALPRYPIFQGTLPWQSIDFGKMS